jgi:3-oxoacyl-[acyl-carrier protein] reductase
MSSGLAVVSGGGTGIGLASAERLLARHDLLIVGRRPEVLAAASRRLTELGTDNSVHTISADLRDPGEVQRVADLIDELSLPLRVLVNNAGGNLAPSPAPELAALRGQYLANFELNVLTAVLLTQVLLDRFSRPGGRIITIGSIAGLRGNASYGAAKAALHPWSAELAIRLAPEGITVNLITPGYIGETEFYQERMSPEFHAARSQQAPVGRGGTPAEVAALVDYLAGPDAGFVTGQILNINGGAWLGRG